MNIQEIINLFHSEFGVIKNRFTVTAIPLSQSAKSNAQSITNPGVYVFWKAGNVLKVGRHLINARKRALEHLVDNTKNHLLEMKNLTEDEETQLLFFNVINSEDRHWVAALEIFLEQNLNPLIRSKRCG